ncbi:hypothetical protein BJY24_005463 [Nocardia transvalensis]|uniref:S-adenosyl methyltransferase n=1 Tax=Nocardia transvalensis TaxID=37333 RepID=A0A7W9PI64_9NOCA|nr:SAM-dependent methyltransferase [Nocardia transvalensis]MBB5916551.1 hypothetical protein [Nocardia transvalensis]
MAEDRPAPEGVDPTRPSSARVIDYLLGGKDNYEADRLVGDRMLAVAPETRTQAWFSRQFLTGAATFAAEAGVRQFIDIGAGIPTSPSVHEAAKKFDTSAVIASVDYDPVVFAHANAMVAGVPGVTPMLADFRTPDELIERLRAEASIDFREPVALLVVGVLHFIMDDERPAEIIARFREVMAPGSYLAFTHGSVETHDDFVAAATGTNGTMAECRWRSKSEIEAMMAGFEVLDPGIVPIQEWLGDDLPATRLVLLGGILRRG